MEAKIVVLPGDGIGPEITEQAVKVLQAVATHFKHTFKFETQRIGGIAIDETGDPLPETTVEACRQAQAILLGAVGGPKWDDPTAKVRPEQGLLGIRKALDLYANLRPVRLFPQLAAASPLKEERLAGVDLLVVRELTGGIYFGQPRKREQRPEGWVAIDTMIYSEPEVERVVRLACELSRARKKKVTSIDKANVLEASRLWRQVATRVGKEFADVSLEHQLVDSAAMRLITGASEFDVIVTGNLFGDILSDEAAVLTGSLGLLPSASINEKHVGLYEPIHGSAPDIAGKGIANPLGTILSAAMLLRHSLGLEQEAQCIENAVDSVLTQGKRTADLDRANFISTAEMGDAVVQMLNA